MKITFWGAARQVTGSMHLLELPSGTRVLIDCGLDYEKRKEFEEGQESYDEFLTKLKRQHAIETGVVEKLYDLTEGITQTLIKNGFVESYIGHNDTNIPPKKLMQYLHDHFEAMDFIFDLVKSNRNLSKSFIKELHQLITQNQDYTEAIDSLGQRINVKLLKDGIKRMVF